MKLNIFSAFLFVLLISPYSVHADKDVAIVDLLTRGMADRSSGWICQPDKTIRCSVEGCEETTPSIMLVLDFSKKKYSRCDSEGCSDFMMNYSKGGVFTLVDLTGRGVFLKASNDGSSFIDVATIGLGSIQNFGICNMSE